MKIILATDFSESAANAAYYALGLADAMQAVLILLHVTEDAVLSAEAAAVGFPYTFIEEDAPQALTALKNQLLATGKKVDIEIKHNCGSLLGTLMALYEEIHFFTVVIGAHGRSAVSRILFGSKASQLVNNELYPVLVVPADMQFNPLRKIALACDMENETEMFAIPFLEKLLNVFQSSLEIVYVGKDDDACVAATQNVNAENRWAAYHPSFTCISNADIQMGLTECTLLHGVDILIITSRKRYLVEKMFHRSVSKQLTWQPPVPVAVVKV